MKSTSINVAQAVSFAIDEVQEFGTSDGAMSLFLDLDTDDQDPKNDLRITEVSAELKTMEMPSGDVSKFTVKTSDGRKFKISVQEVQL
jgi:hypothetical protein